jgi:hypothetical protein
MTVLKHAAWALIVCGLLSLGVLLLVEPRKPPPPPVPQKSREATAASRYHSIATGPDEVSYTTLPDPATVPRGTLYNILKSDDGRGVLVILGGEIPVVLTRKDEQVYAVASQDTQGRAVWLMHRVKDRIIFQAY